MCLRDREKTATLLRDRHEDRYSRRNGALESKPYACGLAGRGIRSRKLANLNSNQAYRACKPLSHLPLTCYIYFHSKAYCTQSFQCRKPGIVLPVRPPRKGRRPIRLSVRQTIRPGEFDSANEYILNGDTRYNTVPIFGEVSATNSYVMYG